MARMNVHKVLVHPRSDPRKYKHIRVRATTKQAAINKAKERLGKDWVVEGVTFTAKG